MTPRRLLPAALFGLALVPAPATAQFQGGFGFNPAGFLPINPYSNPYFSSYRYGYRGVSAYSTTQYGSFSVDASRSYVGTRTGYNRFYRGPYPYAPGNGYGYGPGYGGPNTFGGYFGGGVGGAVGSPYPQSGATQASIAASQVQTAAASRGDVDARQQLFDQLKFERQGAAPAGPPVRPADPAAVEKALRPAAEADVTSADALNPLLVAAADLDKRGLKAASAFLTPDLLGHLHFGGTPTADALDLLRGGKLPFPPAFGTPALVPFRDLLDAQFAEVATAAGSGKTVPAAALTRLSETVARARTQVGAVARDLPFEDAAPTRRLLNDLDGVVKVLRDPATAGVVNPKWAAEGATVADVVRHAARFKLRFAPAGKGDEEAYIALHRGLAGFYDALARQPVRK